MVDIDLKNADVRDIWRKKQFFVCFMIEQS